MPSRILIVDDETSHCRMLGQVLRSEGLETEMHTDSQKAAQALANEKFDAVFLDHRMPAPDGLALATQMRRSGINQNTPIVLITGGADLGLMKHAFAAGVNYFMFKPLDTQRLLHLVRASQWSILQEKRRFQRIPVHCRAILEYGHQQISGVCIDLSLGGLLFESTLQVPRKTLVRIRVDLQARNSLRATGVVVRHTAQGATGIQFGPLACSERERLEEYMLPLILEKDPLARARP